MRLFNYDEPPPDWLLDLLFYYAIVMVLLLGVALVVSLVWGKICLGFG
jgi:hypothetical protein